MKTQVGGKFSRENSGLFALRRNLIAVGIEVSFPENDAIVAEYNGVELTFDPLASGRSLYETECRYLNSIRRSSFHTIFNKNGPLDGYLGVSASMELLYAQIFNVPVFLIHPPICSDKVPAFARQMISMNARFYNIARLDLIAGDALYQAIRSAIGNNNVDYQLNVTDQVRIMSFVDEVITAYK